MNIAKYDPLLLDMYRSKVITLVLCLRKKGIGAALCRDVIGLIMGHLLNGATLDFSYHRQKMIDVMLSMNLMANIFCRDTQRYRYKYRRSPTGFWTTKSIKSCSTKGNLSILGRISCQNSLDKLSPYVKYAKGKYLPDVIDEPWPSEHHGTKVMPMGEGKYIFIEEEGGFIDKDRNSLYQVVVKRYLKILRRATGRKKWDIDDVIERVDPLIRDIHTLNNEEFEKYDRHRCMTNSLYFASGCNKYHSRPGGICSVDGCPGRKAQLSQICITQHPHCDGRCIARECPVRIVDRDQLPPPNWPPGARWCPPPRHDEQYRGIRFANV